MPLRLVVLVSGSGTLLQALLDAQAAGALAAEVVAVGSDRADAYGLIRAERAGVPGFVHPLVKGSDRAAWNAGLVDLVARFDPDLVVSAGFMKLVGPSFLSRFTMVNTHPALLPSFPGMHGVADALAHGVKVTGATLFAVDDGVDTGRILAQEAVRVLPEDTEETLHERIKVVERRILVDFVNEYAGTTLRQAQGSSEVAQGSSEVAQASSVNKENHD
jgi:phosphoribosylglycinamide formyltransferase-1